MKLGKSAISSTVILSPVPFDSLTRSPSASAWWSAGERVNPSVVFSTWALKWTARTELKIGEDGGFGFGAVVPGAGPESAFISTDTAFIGGGRGVSIRPTSDFGRTTLPRKKPLACRSSACYVAPTFRKTPHTRRQDYVFSSPIRSPLRGGVCALERGSVLERSSSRLRPGFCDQLFRVFINAKRESASEEGNTQEIGKVK
jgi:hypothetical protein